MAWLNRGITKVIRFKSTVFCKPLRERDAFQQLSPNFRTTVQWWNWRLESYKILITWDVSPASEYQHTLWIRDLGEIAVVLICEGMRCGWFTFWIFRIWYWCKIQWRFLRWLYWSGKMWQVCCLVFFDKHDNYFAMNNVYWYVLCQDNVYTISVGCKYQIVLKRFLNWKENIDTYCGLYCKNTTITISSRSRIIDNQWSSSWF